MPPSHPSSASIETDVEICPYLGIEEDAQTCLGYPSHWNYCHRCKPLAVIKMSHQRNVCLSFAHTGCPAAASDPYGPLPLELHGRRRKSNYGVSQK